MTDTIRIVKAADRFALPDEPTKKWVRPSPDTGERWKYAGRREGSLWGSWEQVRPARDAEPVGAHVKLGWAALLGRLGGEAIAVEPHPGPDLGTAYLLPPEPPEDTWVRAEPDDGRRWRLRGGWWELQYARFDKPRANDVVPVMWTSLLAVAPHLVVVDETPPVRKSFLGIDPAILPFIGTIDYQWPAKPVTVEDAAEKVPAPTGCPDCADRRTTATAAERDLVVLAALVRKLGWGWVPNAVRGTGGQLRHLTNDARYIS